MSALTKMFIEKLIKETDQNIIEWISLFMYTEAKDLSEIPGFSFTLSTNEYHDINFVKSYICSTYHFVAVLLKEKYIEPETGNSIEEVNFYLSKDSQSEPTEIDIPIDLKKSLITSVERSYDKIFNSNYYDFNSDNSKYIMKSYINKDK